MRDPHVERLHYKIGSGEGIRYENPPPLQFTNPLGRFEARDGALTVEPADHFADRESARAAIDPFLRSWELERDLDQNLGTIRFEFARADVVDRNPPPPGGPISVVLEPAVLRITAGTVTTLLTSHRYPQPPGIFRATPDVESAYDRWRGYRQGKEPLQGMAYFVLTLAVGGQTRADAARRLSVDEDVLRKWGELSSTRGNADTARKVPAGGTFTPLMGAEGAWLEQVVRRVIKRMGEQASGAALIQITMKDFPDL